MTQLERAIAALEAATDADLDRLCGADRITLRQLLAKWDRALAATAPRRQDDRPRAGVLADLKDGRQG